MRPEPDGEAAAERRPRGQLRVPIRIEQALGAAAMALICIISLANVIVRYATDVSFAFTEEYSVFLLVFMTFVGTALGFATDSHIRIGFFVDRLPLPLQRLCEALVIVATLIMFGLIVYYGALLSLDEYRFGETSPGLGYPTWIYTMWLPILSVAIILRVLGRAWARLRGRA